MFELNENDRTLTVYLSGEIDHHSAKAIREETDALLTGRLPKTLVLDFKDVTFMDSSGVGLVMGRYKTARSLGAAVAVRSLTPRDRRMLELSGLTKLVEFR